MEYVGSFLDKALLLRDRPSNTHSVDELFRFPLDPHRKFRQIRPVIDNAYEKAAQRLAVLDVKQTERMKAAFSLYQAEIAKHKAWDITFGEVCSAFRWWALLRLKRFRSFPARHVASLRKSNRVDK